MNAEKSKPPWVMFVLLGCGAIITAFVGFIVFVLFIVLTAVRSTTPYQEAVSRAKSDPRVIAALGTPIETSYFFRGQVNTNNDEGQADLSVSLHGPKDKGTLRVIATRSKRHWSYSTMEVETRGQAIDLRERIAP